jgi:hypothetical protein
MGGPVVCWVGVYRPLWRSYGAEFLGVSRPKPKLNLAPLKWQIRYGVSDRRGRADIQSREFTCEPSTAQRP